ncbi:HEAT repeat domain-containing protein [Salipaludibacillus daqingensis]|uniref:HEAT repeat domain-containing protein n=1 Tax=Salipaludibacillus daqingensis TaxID=3041001 RepID=UPI0024746B3A|nr:HEAT repeat domain-containing protein [Salipaludibacillus daqingensis]
MMIEIALWTAGALLFIQFFLLVYILVGKIKFNRFEAKVEQIYKNILPDYLSFISGETKYEPRLPKSEKLKKEVLERLLNDLADNTANPTELDQIQFIAETHLTTIYQKSLSSDGWAYRVNTLYFIEEFKMFGLKEDVWQHLKTLQHEDEEYRQTLRVLAMFQEDRLIDYMIRQTEMPLGLVKDLFRRFSPTSFSKLVSLLEGGEDSVPLSLELAFIGYCGESGNYEFLSLVEKKMEDSRKEIRLKALRSLCEYQYCSDKSWIKGFFSSEHWEERMYAARLAGIMNLTEYNDDLVFLAGDQSWWVRFAACEAINKIPDGEILLEYVSTQHEDSYARDMAQQTLTMKGGL